MHKVFASIIKDVHFTTLAESSQITKLLKDEVEIITATLPCTHNRAESLKQISKSVGYPFEIYYQELDLIRLYRSG